MKTCPLLVLAEDDGWRVVPCATPDSTSDEASGVEAFPSASNPDGVLDAIRALTAAGPRGSTPSVVIALPAHQCFAARVSAEGLPARGLRQALAYRFEERVPFPVEDLVLDDCGAGDTRLVVAARHHTVSPLVRVLEDNGVRVCAIVPLALLAAQSVSQRAGAAQPSIAAPPVTRLAEAMHVEGSSGIGVSTVSCNDSQPDEWRWEPHSSVLPEDESPDLFTPQQTIGRACDTVHAIALEQTTPWINLQQGPLASRQKLQRVRRPLLACGVAAALMLLVTAIGMQVRAARDLEAARVSDEQSRSLYAQAFPGEQVPASMQRRLDNRLKQIRGRQGLASTEAPLFAEQHTLAVLHDLLQRLPGDRRLVLTDLRIAARRIDLVGHARSHSDADAIAAALRAGGRFEVSPPSTENLPDRGVQFALSLSYLPPGAESGPAEVVGGGDPPLATDQAGQPVSLNRGGAP